MQVNITIFSGKRYGGLLGLILYMKPSVVNLIVNFKLCV